MTLEQMQSRMHAKDLLAYALVGSVRGILWSADAGLFDAEATVQRLKAALAETDEALAKLEAGQ